MEGDSLRDKLRRETQLSIDDALGLAQQVAGALQHAHEQGIMHRDIKPENILLHDGEAMVADFGIALALNTAGGDRLTETGLSIGTPEYMSPEQASGGEHLDARSDVYGLGCVLYEMLAGQPPFTGSSSQAVIARHMLDPAPSVRTVRPSVSAALEGVVQTALAKSPADRWQTAEKFGAALEAAARGVVVIRSGGRGRVGPTIRRTIVSHPKIAIGTGVIAAGLVAGSIVVRMGPTTSTVAAPEPVQLTVSGYVSRAEISPDGDFLAYIEETDSVRLYVQDLTSGGIVQIGEVGASLYSAFRWSPDGSSILVQRPGQGQMTTSIFPRLGGPPQALPRYASSNTVWSPDGSQLATWRNVRAPLAPAALARLGLSDNPPFTIRLMTLATGDTSFLTVPDSIERLYRGEWSPDGRFIALAEGAWYGIDRFWTVAIDGSGWRPIPKAMNSVSPPRWSPSGDAIYYLGHLTGRNWVLRKQAIAPDGTARGEPEVMPTGPLQTYEVSISADGRKLAYIVHEQSYNLWLARPDQGDRGSGFITTQLTSGSTVRSVGIVAPDGAHVAYVLSGAGGGSDLFVLPTSGGVPQRITSSGNVDVLPPAWSPDGSTVAFQAEHEHGQQAIHTVRLDGTQVRTHRDDQEDSNVYLQAWAPGERIVFTRVTDQGYQGVYLLDPETGQEERLVPTDSVTPENAGDYHYSPDGQRVTRVTSNGIEVISVDDFSRRMVSPLRPRPSATRVQVPLHWSDDGRSLYVQRRDSLLLVPVEGGDPTVIGAVPNFGYSVDRYRQGYTVCVLVPPVAEQTFVCRVVRSFRDVWMIENFDPDIR